MTLGGAARADFSFLRYAQCWEDADVLLEALDIGPGHVCLSIASAGDNALSMLSRGPERVVAVDMNPAQLAAVALRVSAYRNLSHPELLQLIGSRGSGATTDGSVRATLYQRCRPDIGDQARAFWDARPALVAAGIGGVGKFENYFRVFRTRVIPLVHSRQRIEELLTPKPSGERERFYSDHWNNRRWKILFRVFFSRAVMGRLGRDPAFFDYVEGSVSDRILRRVRHALTVLEPANNPYVGWILTGTHGAALPHALREENFDAIRRNLDRLECHEGTIDGLLDARPDLRFDRYNLSDIFEYMSEDVTTGLLTRLVDASNDRARLAYWNMLAPRSRPESMRDCLIPLADLAARLHLEDKAFFYSRFVLEEARTAGIVDGDDTFRAGDEVHESAGHRGNARGDTDASTVRRGGADAGGAH